MACIENIDWLEPQSYNFMVEELNIYSIAPDSQSPFRHTQTTTTIYRRATKFVLRMPVRNEADPEWDHHKAKIEYLYVEGNLKLEGPGELMETMAKDYGFTRK